MILSIDASNATGRTVFNLIKNTKSDDYPDGNAGNAWTALEKKIEPKTAPLKAKLHLAFNGAVLWFKLLLQGRPGSMRWKFQRIPLRIWEFMDQ